MSIFVRIWFFFSLILVLTLWFMLNTINDQVRPNVRQVVEDTLAENANIVAQLIAEDVVTGFVSQPEFDQKIQHALSRDLHAQIWQHKKNQIHQQLYITDAKGIVLYDSQGLITGQNYSQWNDVYLTLRGRYGARSTRQNEKDPNSSTMFIAAPIIYQNQLIGVVSLGKPNSSVQPYIDRAQSQFVEQMFWVALVSLFLSSVVAWWLRRSIDKVRRYAQALAPTSQAPHFYSAKELNQVTQAISEMREKLEDRAYVEHYVNTLTHELKSPLTAIQASAEILQDDIPYADQQHFAQHIESQSHRLRDLIERMLLLARLEKAPNQFEYQTFDCVKLIQNLIADQSSRIQQKNIQLQLRLPESYSIKSDPFWLKQAIHNILDNALDFMRDQGHLIIQLEQSKDTLQLKFLNEGEIIPEFAQPHIFEHYYSLARPSTNQRSSGIGLTLVQQVMQGLNGEVKVRNVIPPHTEHWIPAHLTGVCVELTLPM